MNSSGDTISPTLERLPGRACLCCISISARELQASQTGAIFPQRSLRRSSLSEPHNAVLARKRRAEPEGVHPWMESGDVDAASD